MSPAKTGLLASAALAGLAWCLYRVLGPRPLRRALVATIPSAWLVAFAKYTTHAQYLALTQALSSLGTLHTEAAYNTVAHFVTPAQLQSITSDPAWAQGQSELARGGFAP